MTLEALGLWYDEETKYLVDTSPGNFETLSRDGNGWVIRTGLPNQKHPDDADTAVDNYLKCIEPRPLPGEVWEIIPAHSHQPTARVRISHSRVRI